MDFYTDNKATRFKYVPKKRFSFLNSEYRVDFWREATKSWMVVGVLFVMTMAVLGPKAGARGVSPLSWERRPRFLHHHSISNASSLVVNDAKKLYAIDMKCPLHTQYLTYIPLSYIYYSAGRCPFTLPPSRLLVASCAHAHVVAPAICVVVVAALRDVTDYRIVQGAVYSSVGEGCAWLSLALCNSESAVSVTAVIYVSSLVAIPLSMFILCGRAILPSPLDIGSTCLTALIPYAFGVIYQKRHNITIVRLFCDSSRHCNSIEEKNVSPLRSDTALTKQRDATSSNDYDSSEQSDLSLLECGDTPRQYDSTARKLCALSLLYVEFCDRLREAEGIMYFGDVMVTFILELTWLVTSAAACWAYARFGLIPDVHSRTLALCSVPKHMDIDASYATWCGVWGASRVPAAFAAPARAALLAALAR